MDFGINADFTIGSHPNHASALRAAMEEVDLAEEMGLDTVWLGEMHFNPNRSVLSAPIVIASSIATRTKNLRVGMAVQVLPLIHPLRIAEEAATVDQLSEGRFEFGIGRSGNVRAYDIMGIDYGESRERFQEALDIILMAWSGETFSYEGKYNTITNATLSPLPYQQPHPKVRIAASSDDSFGRIGRLGQPIFLGLRAMDVEDLKNNLEDYKSEWDAAGHPTEGGDINVRFPMYIAQRSRGHRGTQGEHRGVFQPPTRAVRVFAGPRWRGGAGTASGALRETAELHVRGPAADPRGVRQPRAGH